MADTERKGPWRVVSEQVAQYLIATRKISDWLSDFSVPDENDEDPDFSGLEQLISDRKAIQALIGQVDRAELERDAADEDEQMCRKLSLELLGDIAEIEQDNEDQMQKLASKYREKLKNVKQARETINTYGRAQTYGMQQDMVGTHFNQAN